jgi:hypothetical protein
MTKNKSRHINLHKIIILIIVAMCLICTYCFKQFNASDNPKKDIVFIRNSTLFKCPFKMTYCKNPIEIHQTFFEPDNYLLIENGKKLIFVDKNGNNLWIMNTDGANIRQKLLTNNQIYTTEQLKTTLKIEDTANKRIYFTYDKNLPYSDNKLYYYGKDQETKYSVVTPELKSKWGTYYYDLVTEKIQHVSPEISDKTIPFQIVDGVPIYLMQNGKYAAFYTLDIQTGKFSKFIEEEFDDLNQYSININSNLGIIVYLASNLDYNDKTPDQIILFDYKHKKKIEVTPKGRFGQYSNVKISPNFKTIIYKNSPSIYGGDVYSYNISSKKTKKIDLVNSDDKNEYILMWINNHSFLYGVDFVNPFDPYRDPKNIGYYKYDLSSNKGELFLENVQRLIF